MNLGAALAWFDGLPWQERWFVRGRARSAPLLDMAAQVKGPRVVDVGCGHGLLSALLVSEHPDFSVLGIDVDPRKIQWAQAAVGRAPNARFAVQSIEALAAEQPHAFDSVCIADVLYLLEAAAWPAFLRAARTLLRDGGQLVLKEAEDDGSWKVTKAALQEALMVRVLRRTQGSGGLGFQPRPVLLAALQGAGFADIEVTPIAGFSTPHVLFVAKCV